jgi:glycosyltransferase involved in cell wall biosynthesis
VSARPDRTVGIVMTAYNSEQFITAALRSLREQTITHWECVVVDDGSTDSTAAAVEQMADEDRRIRLLRQRPGGVSRARNTGLAALSDNGPYVGLLDSDDCYLPDALEFLVAALDARPDAVGVFGLAEYIDQDGRPFRPGEHPALQRARRAVDGFRFVDLDPTADSTFADLSVSGAIWPSAVGLHRRVTIAAVGGFDPSFTRQGDWELYLRMSRQGPFAAIDRQVAWYRRHGGNLTGNVIESQYQRERVRRKTWRSPTNTAMQRHIVARGARRMQLVDIRRALARLAKNISARCVRPAVAEAVGLVIMMANLFKPGPPRPSRRRVRWTQTDHLAVNACR